MSDRQKSMDSFYWSNGPCCAGCDWWRHTGALIGECTRSAPVSAAERLTLIGIESMTGPQSAGHILTKREHACGEFRDGFDWSSLPPQYLRTVGARQEPAKDGGRE